jgi:inhibitor of cysteine peptidase
MKTMFLLTLAVFFSVAAVQAKDGDAAKETEKAGRTLTDSTNGCTMKIAVGEAFDVALKGNPTTGYGWTLKKIGGGAVAQKGEMEYVADKHPGQRVGGGGMSIFHFEVKKAGKTKIELTYARPWEKDTPPLNTFSATIDSSERIDPAEVRRKIATLAVRDETMPYDQQPEYWLGTRCNQITPQLIAALDEKNQKIVERCLYMLQQARTTGALTDGLLAFLAKTGEENPKNQRLALIKLQESAGDPRVAKVLEAASRQAEKFPEPLDRLRWAALAGNQQRAVDILKTTLQKNKEPYQIPEMIRILADLRVSAAVPELEAIAAGDHWWPAAAAYKALAEIDPAKHSLTESQAYLVDKGGRFKEDNEYFYKRIHAMAARLNVRETRPMVIQMLHDEGYGARQEGLAILAAWKDKESLPEVRKLLRDARSWPNCDAIRAYLSIAESRQAEKEMLDLLEDGKDFCNDTVFHAVAAADISAEHKAAFFREAGAKVKSLVPIINALRGEMHDGSYTHETLTLLMDQETNLPMLGDYCRLAAEDKEKRFAAQVRRAMSLFIKEPAAMGADQQGVGAAGQAILEAVAVYNLKDLAPAVEKLMGSQNPAIRSAAEAAGAKLGVAAALKPLYDQLGDKDLNVRRHAAESLLRVKPFDEADRAARENAALACVGKPAEDYAMRVLATCGGPKTVETLAPILDGDDVRRAIYAAWVMAQLPDKTAAEKGIRRVAIFGLFNHCVYQQGAGIDFSIAPDLNFHQMTGRLNPDPRAYAGGEGPVRIPEKLLSIFSFDEAEQPFAVRCYRLTESSEYGWFMLQSNVDFLHANWWSGRSSKPDMDKSHLPLLREVAVRDSHIERLMVQGRPVSHFSIRRLAAQAIAAITKEKAAYIGLVGETLDSEAFPKPYPNQEQLLATYFVDRIENARLVPKPQRDADWRRIDFCREPIRRTEERLRCRLGDAIRQEAKRRGVDVSQIVKEDEPPPPIPPDES